MNKRRRNVKRVIAVLMALFVVATTAYYGNIGPALAEAPGAAGEDQAAAGSADEEVDQISGQSDDGQPEDTQTDGSEEENPQTPDDNSGSTDESGENGSDVPDQTTEDSGEETSDDQNAEENGSTEETTEGETEDVTPAPEESITSTPTQNNESLYDQLMAAKTIDAMDGIIGNANEEDAKALTADQLQALIDKANGFEDDADGIRAGVLAILSELLTGVNATEEADTLTATFIPTIANATVAYVHFTSNNYGSVTSGSLTPVTSTFTNRYNNNVANYWLFFVKADDNYLLTGLGASGNGDLYLTTASSFGNINDYPGISDIAAWAAGQGYVAMFGYTRAARDSLTSANFQVNCESPDITVTAVSDKTSDVKPGDKLNFTVTITPGHTTSGRDTVKGVSINSLTVNGQTVEYSDVKSNGDGTYTVTVPYTATAEDCASGSVGLEVTATVDYTCTVNLNDTSGSTGNYTTESTVTKSATATCLIAPKNKVTYTHTYRVPDGITITTYPSQITGNPVDTEDYYVGAIVTVDTTYPKMGEVDDPVNGGVWTFDGWYLDNKKVETAEMTSDGLTFTGVWTFTPTTKTVTVTKQVTGNMGDKTKKFTFTVSAESGTLAATQNCTLTNGVVTAELANGDSATITVPYGANITIAETGGDGYTTTYKIGEETEVKDDSCVISQIKADTAVTFINNKEVNIDTGIGTDGVPYVLLLSFAGAGYYTLTIRRRRSGR